MVHVQRCEVFFIPSVTLVILITRTTRRLSENHEIYKEKFSFCYGRFEEEGHSRLKREDRCRDYRHCYYGCWTDRALPVNERAVLVL
jgi:hypothetical protein